MTPVKQVYSEKQLRAMLDEKRLLAPEMVEKLVRHFGQKAKIRVLIDYDPRAVPWASPDGVVSIPAWMRADQMKPLLGAILHETGHVEFDAPDNKKLIASGMHKSPVYYMIYNVVLDARLDARRLEQYPGAIMMYDAVWEQEKVSKKIARFGGVAKATAILKVALAEAIGMGHALAPELREHVKQGGKEALVERLASILRRAKDVDKSVCKLVAEVVEELVNEGPWETEMGCVPWPQYISQKLGKPHYEEADGKKVLGAARETINKFVDAEKGDPKKLTQQSFLAGMADAIAWITGEPLPDQREQLMAATGLNPMEDAAYEPPDPETVKRAIAQFFREAVSAFVSAVEDVPAPDEFPYMIDTSKLALAMTDPDEVMLGDKSEHTTSAAVDIIVDVSGSMFDAGRGPNSKVRRALEAARLWADTAKDVGAKNVKVGFVPFASLAKRNLDFTNLHDLRLESITMAAIKDVDMGGGTDLEAAIKISEEDLRKVHARRRAIVVISDGEVTQEAIDRARKLLRSDLRLAVLTVVGSGCEDEQVASLVSTDVFNYIAKSRDAAETAFAKALLDACARGYDD